MKYLITVEELEPSSNYHSKVWNIEDNEDTAEIGRKVVDIIATINENKYTTPFEMPGFADTMPNLNKITGVSHSLYKTCEHCEQEFNNPADYNSIVESGYCERCAKKLFK